MRQIMRSSLDYAGFAQLCGRSPIMREIMRALNRIIPRSLSYSVKLPHTAKAVFTLRYVVELRCYGNHVSERWICLRFVCRLLLRVIFWFCAKCSRNRLLMYRGWSFTRTCFSTCVTQELFEQADTQTDICYLQCRQRLSIMSAADVDQQLSSLSPIHGRSRSTTSLQCDKSPTPVPSPDGERLLINSMQFIESPKKTIVPNHILDTSMYRFA